MLIDLLKVWEFLCLLVTIHNSLLPSLSLSPSLFSLSLSIHRASVIFTTTTYVTLTSSPTTFFSVWMEWRVNLVTLVYACQRTKGLRMPWREMPSTLLLNWCRENLENQQTYSGKYMYVHTYCIHEHIHWIKKFPQLSYLCIAGKFFSWWKFLRIQ